MEEFKESKKEEEGCLEEPSKWAEEREEAHIKDWSDEDEVREDECTVVKMFGLWMCLLQRKAN